MANDVSSVLAAQVGTTEGVRDDLDVFVEALQTKFHGLSGNMRLREHLGWDEERYWNAHGRAIDTGKVIKGTGRGGSVRMLLAEQSVAPIDEGQSAQANGSPLERASREEELYEPALRVVTTSWVKSQRYDNVLAEVTAAKGKAATGGKWTRPDISILGIKSFPFLPGRHFDITTFEIKPLGLASVEGVFEALSHQQFATRSYVVFVVGQRDGDYLEKHPNGERILGTARKHGIGVILTKDISNWETWDEVVEAERVSPDPEQANRFIATCFSEQSHEQIIKWHK